MGLGGVVVRGRVRPLQARRLLLLLTGSRRRGACCCKARRSSDAAGPQGDDTVKRCICGCMRWWWNGVQWDCLGCVSQCREYLA